MRKGGCSWGAAVNDEGSDGLLVYVGEWLVCGEGEWLLKMMVGDSLFA